MLGVGCAGELRKGEVITVLEVKVDLSGVTRCVPRRCVPSPQRVNVGMLPIMYGNSVLCALGCRVRFDLNRLVEASVKGWVSMAGPGGKALLEAWPPPRASAPAASSQSAKRQAKAAPAGASATHSTSSTASC